MRETGFLLLGWLLGLLAPAIVDAIRQRREGAKVQTALAQELQQLGYRLMLGCHSVKASLGVADLEHLQWLRGRLEKYRGPADKARVVQYVDMLLALEDRERERALARERLASHRAARVQRHAVPLLDSRLTTIWSMQESLQAALLDIRTNLDMLNREVDEVDYFFRLTYDSRGPEQQQIVDDSLQEAVVRWTDRATLIVDKLEQIDGQLK